MDGNGVVLERFDSAAFWQEANSALARGTREMLLSAREKDGLVLAYDRMDNALGDIVERHSPPEMAREELNRKLRDRISLVGRMMRAANIDVERYWDSDMKSVSMLLLKSLGKTRGKIFAIDSLVEDAVDALCEGNFRPEGAKRLLAELSTYQLKNVRELASKLGESPGHMELLRLLSEKGTAKAKLAARGVLDSMMPTDLKPMAKVIPIQMAAMARTPLRHS